MAGRKRKMGYILGVFIASFCISAIAQNIAAIRIANGEWEPFYSEKLPGHGRDSVIVSESFQNQGITVKYEFYPWERSFMLSEKGRVDGTIGWPKTPVSEITHFFSAQPINTVDWVFFYRKESKFDWNTIEDLAPLTVGITDNDWAYYGNDGVSQAIKNEKLNMLISFSDNVSFKKLAKGKIDVLVAQKEVGYYRLYRALEKSEADNIVHHPKVFNQMKLYLLLSKKKPKNQALMRQFDAGFALLKSSGQYKKLMSQLLPNTQ